jgi:RNA polymerase II subunit A small phosphatase-like protein
MNFGSKRQTGLTVDTTVDATTTEPLSDNNHLTNAATTPPGVRGHHDLRSPGVKKTPTAIGGGFAVEYEDNSDDNDDDDVELLPTSDAIAGTPSPPITTAAAAEEQQSFIPDFITQTDRYGNATTPRNGGGSIGVGGISNGTAIVQNQQTGGEIHLQQQQQQQHQTTDASVDSYDTILDGFKSMMCCCLLPPNDGGEQHQQHNNYSNGVNNNNNDTSMNGSNGMININSPTANNNNMLGYSTRGHDAPLLFEEDSALRNATNPNRIKLLPQIQPSDYGKKCLVLDLDETLVHSSFRAVPGADFVLPVQIDDVVHFVYVMKRPGVDEFLVEMSKYYEIVIYTASLNKYADPLLDLLDPNHTIRTRLFRESCVFYGGNYVKDMSLINRDLKQSIIIDNSPSSYMFHPENAIDCSSFIDDPHDCELAHIGKFLFGIKDVEDVRGIVNLWRQWPNIDLSTSHYRTEC